MDNTASPPTAAEPAIAPGETIVMPDPAPVAATPLSPLRAVVQSVAFALSALLSPYLVIPAGTVGIVTAVSQGRRTFFLWMGLSVLFSTVIPALYVVVQILRGKITDVHVMEREQRGGPFLVAILSSAIGAWILHAIKAPFEVWGVGVVLTVNGIVLTWITTFWKISMHVAVLSATIFAAIIMIPEVGVWKISWLIPALMWARLTRGRHSLWQGIGGATVAVSLTAVALSILYFIYNIEFRHNVLRVLGI